MKFYFINLLIQAIFTPLSYFPRLYTLHSYTLHRVSDAAHHNITISHNLKCQLISGQCTYFTLFALFHYFCETAHFL